jgi:hypothetical protein
MKSKYSIPVIASALILTMVLSSFIPVMAQVPTIGPKLDVKTIAQDDQKREKGIILLGLVPNPGWTKGYSDELGQPKLWSQHKLLVSLNGLTILWRIGSPGPVITCNVLEKDKANPVNDKFGKTTKQFPEENLVTKLYDVSDKFICKPRWKSPAGMPGWYESVGVLDVYYVGPLIPTVIADNILVVQASLLIGRVVVQGTDMQDVCVLGWSMSSNDEVITLPDGGKVIFSSADALGDFVGCEQAALEQRDNLGVPIAVA